MDTFAGGVKILNFVGYLATFGQIIAFVFLFIKQYKVLNKKKLGASTKVFSIIVLIITGINLLWYFIGQGIYMVLAASVVDTALAFSAINFSFFVSVILKVILFAQAFLLLFSEKRNTALFLLVWSNLGVAVFYVISLILELVSFIHLLSYNIDNQVFYLIQRTASFSQGILVIIVSVLFFIFGLKALAKKDTPAVSGV